MLLAFLPIAPLDMHIYDSFTQSQSWPPLLMAVLNNEIPNVEFDFYLGHETFAFLPETGPIYTKLKATGAGKKFSFNSSVILEGEKQQYSTLRRY